MFSSDYSELTSTFDLEDIFQDDVFVDERSRRGESRCIIRIRILTTARTSSLAACHDLLSSNRIVHRFIISSRVSKFQNIVSGFAILTFEVSEFQSFISKFQSSISEFPSFFCEVLIFSLSVFLWS